MPLVFLGARNLLLKRINPRSARSLARRLDGHKPGQGLRVQTNVSSLKPAAVPLLHISHTCHQVGCGNGRHTVALAKSFQIDTINVHGCDVVKQDIKDFQV